MPKVDDLYIEITSDSKKADKSLNDLVNTLSKVQASLRGFNSSGMSGLTNSVRNLSAAMVGLNNVGAKDYTRLAKGIRKIAELDSANITRAGASLVTLSKGLQQLDSIKVSDNSKQIADLANGISKLGYKSATNAIENIPKLASAMRELMATLSTAPKVSQNLINMTNALGNLARTGASSGRAANSLGKSLNFYSSTTGKATKKSFSLAGAIGKLYATYWLLFRAFGKLGDSINIASDLTEVQNVVDVTFGKYKGMVENMAKTSISDFGMSELTVKQISSRFQAMGSAMGFAQGEMAKTSIALTSLAADMSSFYNVSQEDVAKDLESIFTGETRPLRTYGLDLTQANLKQFALKQGMDANIESMSQMEKTMLRYQYVMANTGAAQGDFLRTQDTWANQVRILKQNLEQLSIVVGRTFINALKPLVKYLNVAVQAITQFAQMVSDALGKIFGWKYEVGSGGITADIDDAADGAGDLSSGLGNAVDSAKKLRQQLHGIDELNVLTTDTAGKGSGGGSGTGAGTGTASGGSWTQDADSMFKAYESEIDTLYKLGEKIGETLSNALSSIDWDKVYEKARNFGSGLAEFLNGLISPELFGSTGKAIAASLNTALYALNTFGHEFDWKDFGNSIAEGINEFFKTFDAKGLADTINTWIKGALQAVTTLLKKTDFEQIGQKIGQFLNELDFGGMLGGMANAIWTGMQSAFDLLKGLISEAPLETAIIAAMASFKYTSFGAQTGQKIAGSIAESLKKTETFSTFEAALKGSAGMLKVAGGIVAAIGAALAGYEFGTVLNEWITGEEVELSFTAQVKEITMSASDGTWKKAMKLWKEDIDKNTKEMVVDIAVSLGFERPDAEKFIGKTQAVFNGLGKFITITANPVMGIAEAVNGIKESWAKAKEAIGNLILNVSIQIPNIVADLQTKWNEMTSWWGENRTLPVGTKVRSAKKEAKSLWKGIKSAWKSGDKKLTITTVAKLAGNAVNSMQSELNKTRLTLHADVEFKIEDGVRLNWDSGVKKWFYYQNGQKFYMAANGGLFQNGKWKDVTQYAGGGLPSMGELFVAREAGPELVGKIGNSTAVVNNQQIVSSVSDGVYRAVMAAMSQVMSQRQNVNVDVVLEGDARGMFKAVQAQANDYSNRTGRPAFA